MTYENKKVTDSINKMSPTGKKEKTLIIESLKELQDMDSPIPNNNIDESLSKFKYICENPTCEYGTNVKSKYNRHLSTSRHLKLINGESTTKLYKCEYDNCEHETHDRGHFRRHKLLHEGIIECAYFCLACDEHIRDNDLLIKHWRKFSHQMNVKNNYPECFKFNYPGSNRKLGGKPIVNDTSHGNILKR